MRFSPAALLLGAAGLAVASDVVDLKKDTFNEFVESNNLVLAEFFAPWCGHCKALAPEYEEAATALKEKNIALAKIDCTAEEELCKEHGVEGYPTLKVFRGLDTVTAYNSPRKADAIISYMTKQSLPAVSDVTAESIEEFKTADKIVLVAFFDKDDKESNATFTSIADRERDNYLFGATNDPAVAKAEGVKAPALILYKSFDEGKDVYDGKWDKDEISKFAKVNSIPLVGEVSPETYTGYIESKIPLAYIFAETKEERDAFVEELRDVAKAHKGAVNFATIDAKAFGGHAANLNLEADRWPAFAIQDIEKNMKYTFSQDEKITKKAIQKFVDDFVGGKIEPTIKSEAVPDKQEGFTVVVVAHTYKSIVLDEDKDVLIEFYAPWCGHCKALAPKYEELAEAYGKDFKDKVVIAKIDATANDVPDDISGFPTIKLYPAGAKDAPVVYSGDRSVADLAKFVSENGKYKADAYAAGTNASEEDEGIIGKMAEAASQAGEAVKSVADAAAGGDDEVKDEL